MGKNINSILILIVGMGIIYQVETCNYPIPKENLVPVETIKANVKSFEEKGSKFKQVMWDYRSNEPSYKELYDFLTAHTNVTTVIRLNGEGRDGDFAIETEKILCQSLGVNFIYSPMPFNYNYKDWAETITKVMLKETVLIHCHHGYDRTGFMFAYKLMKHHGYTFNQVQKMNGWDKYDVNSRKFYSTLKSVKCQ